MCILGRKCFMTEGVTTFILILNEWLSKTDLEWSQELINFSKHHLQGIFLFGHTSLDIMQAVHWLVIERSLVYKVVGFVSSSFSFAAI